MDAEMIETKDPFPFRTCPHKDFPVGWNGAHPGRANCTLSIGDMVRVDYKEGSPIGMVINFHRAGFMDLLLEDESVLKSIRSGRNNLTYLETHKRTEFQPKVYFALTDLQDLDVLKQIKEYEGTNYGNLYPYALTLEEDIFEFRMHVV